MAECTVRLFSHNFEITKLTPRARTAVTHFARRYIEHKQIKKKPSWYGQSNQSSKYDCVYATATDDRSEYRFHVNQLEDFKEHLKLSDLNFERDVDFSIVPLYEPRKVELRVQSSWKPDPEYKQPEAIEFLTNWSIPRKLLGMPPGYGKAQPLDAKVKVPGGWITMGEVKVGTMVTAKDGSSVRVTEIHPQGVKSIYQIEFKDGRFTQCCADHLWRVKNKDFRDGWRILNTLEVMGILQRYKNPTYVELIDPEDGPDCDLPISPYTLGVLLGDAHLGVSTIMLANPDQEIIDSVRAELPDDLVLTHRKDLTYQVVKKSGLLNQNGSKANRYLDLLRELSIAGKLSHEKFVPEAYLNGSRNQRLALLQGLMDTDGTSSESGQVSFCSTSVELAKSVQYLVRSLGGIANFTSCVKYYSYKGEKKAGRQAYLVSIRYKRPNELFRLRRKKDRLPESNQYSDGLKLAIKSIVEVGQKPAQCITIDHPDHLYVTDDFIVTHNSYSTMQAIANLGVLSVWSVQAKYVEKTRLDLLRTYDMAEEDVLIIDKTKDLKTLFFMSLDALPECKVILISSKLIQIWFSLYKKMGAGIEVIGYAIAPQYFYQSLGAGVRVIDEAHQEFHFNFLQDLYTHVPMSISLSATMQFDNATRNRMALMTYPRADRFEVAYTPYISATAITYEFEKPERIKVLGKQGTYSHHVFEESVMKDKKVLGHYLDMIDLIVRKELLTDRLEGERMIIYAAGVDFCTILVDDLKKRHPHLKINRYCGSAGDDYDDLLTSDICVSTLGSAGTNVDIPNLKCALLTTAVDSSQSNIQGAGRLRDKLQPGRVPRFVWLTCEQIARHMVYHDKKLEILRTRAKILNQQFYGVLL